MHLFYRDLRDVGFLIFQPAFWREGPAVVILRQLCLGRVAQSPAGEGGSGHNVNWYFWAFVLWRLSLAVCCASSESQSSSGRISASVTEQRDCSLFSTDVLATLTPLLLVLLNPAVSWDVYPTSNIPALTSRAGMSLSFVFLTPPAASRPSSLVGSQAPRFSVDCTRLRRVGFQSGRAHAPERSVSV